MKRNTFVNLFLCLMIVTFAFTGCGGGDDLSKYSKIVTFKGAIKAPRDFDCFSFFWESPTLDPDSELEYVIIRPNGKVFIQKTFTASGITAPGMRNRLDFDEELTGENPKVFLKSDVNFSFRAKKGDIVFDPNGLYYFKFFKGGFEGTEVAVIDAASDQVKTPTR